MKKAFRIREEQDPAGKIAESEENEGFAMEVISVFSDVVLSLFVLQEEKNNTKNTILNSILND